ncbi:(Na+)-NQR maturation NqrM [Marinomonas agarivorans]|nr:(Na+)-NQR maturation NqrM [Marinomonas agarivorans]
MLLVVIAMSVGVLLGRKPISGSCGGMSALGMEVACDICGGDTAKCEKESKRVVENDISEGQYYDATK